MSNVPTYLCHIAISPSSVAQALFVVDRWGKWGSHSLWVLENIVDTVLGSDVLSHYCSKQVASVKLPEMNMVANHAFVENKNSAKQGGRKVNISHTVVLPWGRCEGSVTLLSSSVDWYHSWLLGSCNSVSPKANLWMFNQTVLVPSYLDVGVSCFWNFPWNPGFCKMFLLGIRDVSHQSCHCWTWRYPITPGTKCWGEWSQREHLGTLRMLCLLPHMYCIVWDFSLLVGKFPFLITQQENVYLVEEMINYIKTSICNKILARFEVIGLQGRTA